jgi:hypothetical protein
MKPPFSVLYRHYPDKEEREALLARIGWGDVINKPSFTDTCAIRMSVGLVGAGVGLPGARMSVKAGPLKGRPIEPGQGKLSWILKRVWGAPEIYRDSAGAAQGIGMRRGVISFFRIHGGGPNDGGHIDLIWPGPKGFHDCARSRHFSAVEFWFWPLT